MTCSTWDFDVWDLEQLRLSPEMRRRLVPRKPLPHHRRGDPFIKGPIAFGWIASACRLPGVGLHVAMAYRFLCSRFRAENRWGLDKLARGLQVGRDTARRGLVAAEFAGLLSVEREPGCKLVVSISNLAGSEIDLVHRPLYGPLPWSWWLPASRLPGKSLQVASVCWLLAGWERSADFELAAEDWAEFGLSRFSVGRGLDALERAGLLFVTRRPGLSPIVSIRDPTGS